MRASAIIEVIKASFESKAQRPLYIWGPPGVGKSSIVAAAGDALGVPVYDLRPVHYDPTDIRGIPIPKEGKAFWLPPSFLPTIGPGIMCLDELNAAPPAVQAAFYQLILDRRVGEYRLPDRILVVAASNRASDRAVTHRLSSALANRFEHIDFEHNIKDWTAWAQVKGIQPQVVAFLNFKSEQLFQFDPQRDERAFPTPRTWEYVSDELTLGLSLDVQSELIEGTVGKGASSEFNSFIRLWGKLPDPDEILVKGNFIVPPALDLKYALVMAVIHRSDASTLLNAIKYASALPPEFGVLLMQGLVLRHPEAILMDKAIDKEFNKWGKKNVDVLL